MTIRIVTPELNKARQVDFDSPEFNKIFESLERFAKANSVVCQDLCEKAAHPERNIFHIENSSTIIARGQEFINEKGDIISDELRDVLLACVTIVNFKACVHRGPNCAGNFQRIPFFDEKGQHREYNRIW